jgi:hypothetical protein
MFDLFVFWSLSIIAFMSLILTFVGLSLALAQLFIVCFIVFMVSVFLLFILGTSR